MIVGLATGAVLSATLAAVTTGVTSAVAAEPAAAGVTGAAGYLAPYYTKGDLTGDQQLTQDDLDLLVPALGTVTADAGWAAVAPADYDADGVITMSDVTNASLRIMYDDGEFDLIEASAVDMQKALNAGVVTSVELTQDYLDRIAAYDSLTDTDHARALNSIITAGGQKALDAAAESDAARAANGGPRSMVDGIPILLKDNYDTEDMPTSAGTGSWTDNQTEDDAFMVAGLRDAGAVILGKASLDEFALGFASEYSAGLPAGTSKLVASPYVLSRTAGGSSGGTGASIAANLGAIGFGTDTGGSIRVPASYNQLVGIRPTVGLTSRDGIVPLALSQDTGGPIARSVSDAAIALDSVVGIDPNDPITSEQNGNVPDSYTKYLDPTALQGKRIGYLTTMVGTNATTVRLFNQAVLDLTAQGATVVPITTTALNATLNEGSGSTNEFKHDLDVYIANHLDADIPERTLRTIIDAGRMVPTRAATYNGRDNITPAQYATWMGTHNTAIANGEIATTALMDANTVDALIYPSGNPYATQGTNLRLSPNTGMPSVTVPMGQATSTETIPGAGVNLEFLGRNYTEGDLIGLTYAYEQATHFRTTPSLYPALAPTTPVTPKTAKRADGYTVAVSDSEVEIGDEVTVTVTADAATDLYAYDLAVDFDPSVLEYVDGSATTDVSGATYEDASDAATGEVSLVHTKLGTSPAAGGATTLTTMTFRAVAEGSTDVSAASLDAATSDATVTTTTDLASAPVSVDLLAAPVATTAPTVAGQATVGYLLRATGGEWDVADTTLSYRWLRDGAQIPGATDTTYRLTPADAGATISVLVDATATDHAVGQATSESTSAVAKATTTTKWTLTPAKPKAGVKPVAKVVVSAPGITPTGTVKVTYAGKVVKAAVKVVNGKVSVTLPQKKKGSYSLRVVFTPDAGFKTSLKVAKVTVR